MAGLKKLISSLAIAPEDQYLFMELALHGLAEFNVINKEFLESRFSFRDLLADMLNDDFDE